MTGGAGFIGSEFVAQQIEAGNRVVVLDAFTYAGHRANLDWISAQEGQLVIVEGDICDRTHTELLLGTYEVDAVFNFAAESHVDNSIANPGAFVKTNVDGVYRMLEASRDYYTQLDEARKEAFRFIQVSTDEVYGTLELDDPAFDEETPMKPNSPYSATKAAGDHMARAWFHTYNFPTIVTNCSNNYGHRQFPEKLIPHMISKALAGEKLPIYGDGQNIRDWIHVSDHCRGVFLAYAKGNVGETYCFGGNAERNNIQTVDAICQALDALRPRPSGSYKELKSFVNDRPGHDKRYAINDAKAVEKLGFNRRYQFEAGIAETVKWYLDNQQWVSRVLSESQSKAA